MYNASRELADFLAGGERNNELGFIADFKSNDTCYELHIYEEGFGDRDVEINGLFSDTFLEDFTKHRRRGYGHTHPSGTDTHIYSEGDLDSLLGSYFRPEVLLTQQNGILYLPLTGLFYIPKERIEVVSVNEEKKLIDIRSDEES